MQTDEKINGPDTQAIGQEGGARRIRSNQLLTTGNIVSI